MAKVLKCKGRREDGRLKKGYKLVKGGVVKVGRSKTRRPTKRRQAAPKAAAAPKRKRRAAPAKGAATFPGPSFLGVETIRFRPLKPRSVVEATRYDFSGRGPGAVRRGGWGGVVGLLEYKPAAPSIRRSGGGIGGQLSLFG